MLENNRGCVPVVQYCAGFVLSAASLKKMAGGPDFASPPALQAELGVLLDSRPHVHLNTRRQLSEIGILGQRIIGRLNG